MRQIINGLIIGLVFATPLAQAGMVEIKEKMPSIFVDISYARPARAAIMPGTIRANGTSPFLQSDLTNLGNRSEDNSYSIGIGFWLPTYEWKGFTFNSTASIRHIPMRAAQSVAPAFTPPGTDDLILPSLFTIKSSFLNMALGLNAMYHLDEQWFFIGGLEGGVSRYHVHGHMTSYQEDNSRYQDGVDHPGVEVHSPFISGELGVGKVLSAKTKAYLFARYARMRNVSNPILAQLGQDDGRIVVDVPNHWYQIGLRITRDINI